MRLKGKIAFISGGARGMGAAEAMLFAKEGASIGLGDVLESEGKVIEEKIIESGGQCLFTYLDVTSEKSWEEAITVTVEKFGGLDILVNNAGIAVLRPMSEMTSADWHKQISVNLDSVYLGTKVAVDQMRVQGHGGSIVNLSSIAGLVGVQGTAAYAASKGGVRLFSKSVALETARDNIRVNTVQPGMIWTDMQQVAIADNKEIFDQIVATIPMGRMGEPSDIGSMVAFLASDDARYITGCEFVVDGGMVAQ